MITNWKKPLIGFSFILIFSCTTESNITSDNNSIEVSSGLARSISPEKISYASTISNLVATFPKFKNDAVNSEVKNLKQDLMGYLNALQTYNNKEKEQSIKHFESSYKKIQKLRKYVNPDDDQVLNRYLVKIKTNINLLEAIDSKESRDVIISK